MPSPKGSGNGSNWAWLTRWPFSHTTNDSPPPEPSKSPIGGQAVIEGVMMVGDQSWAVTVRAPDGSLRTKITPRTRWAKRGNFLGLPLIRGLAILVETSVLGFKAMSFSTSIAESQRSNATPKSKAAQKPEPQANSQTNSNSNSKSKAKTKPPKKSKPKPEPKPFTPRQQAIIEIISIITSTISGLALSIFLFLALPHVLSQKIGLLFNFNESDLLFHFIDGLIKMALLLAYIWAIGLIPMVGRLFAYHGAEHQAIYAYEASLPLTPQSASSFPTWHKRCGTAFVFMVLIISFVFFSIFFPIIMRFWAPFQTHGTAFGLAIKFILMFPIVALSYEIERLAVRKKNNRFLQALIWPGLLLQRLTTRRPDESQLQVALYSLESVLTMPSVYARSAKSIKPDVA
ncbi:MAG: DUF1385 domain-containing protein [Deltaproteobacteria bacterium]|nr:DUF1385 domain-containing protein [Deltaproteobacteria bacterium]